MTSILYKLILVIVFSAVFSTYVHSQDEYRRGVEYYNKGANEKAIKLLVKASKNAKMDSETWNYLGLAYTKKKKTKKARKAFKRAIKYGPSISAYHSNMAHVYLLERKLKKARKFCKNAINLDSKNANAYYFRGLSFLWESKFKKAAADAESAILADPKFAAFYILKSKALLYTFGLGWAEASAKSAGKEFTATNLEIIKQSKSAIERCLSDCSAVDRTALQAKLISISIFYDYFKKRASITDKAIDPKNTDEKTSLNILSKPRSSYTDLARQNNVQGTIVIAAVFSSEGKIKNVFILKGLGSGLDQSAVNAARRIRFKPATLKGQPVAVIRILQYKYSIY